MTQQSHSWAYSWKNNNNNLKDTRSPVFTVALFTIVKTRKQLNVYWREWLQKMRYIYTKEHDSAMKNEMMAFAAIRTDLEIIYYLLSIISEKGTSYGIIHKWDLI